jgi:HK97 family phage major capsid protein
MCLLKLKEPNTGRHIWQPSLQSGAPSTLFGYNVYIMDDMPAVVSGESSDSILFGNFKRAYQIVDRSGMTILRDPYSSKPYVEFYATKRVGGAVIDTKAYKMLRFSE